MPWNYDQMQTLPIANLERFSDPISDEYDNHVSTKILEIIGKICNRNSQQKHKLYKSKFRKICYRAKHSKTAVSRKIYSRDEWQGLYLLCNKH